MQSPSSSSSFFLLFSRCHVTMEINMVSEPTSGSRGTSLHATKYGSKRYRWSRLLLLVRCFPGGSRPLHSVPGLQEPQVEPLYHSCFGSFLEGTVFSSSRRLACCPEGCKAYPCWMVWFYLQEESPLHHSLFEGSNVRSQLVRSHLHVHLARRFP